MKPISVDGGSYNDAQGSYPSGENNCVSASSSGQLLSETNWDDNSRQLSFFPLTFIFHLNGALRVSTASIKLPAASHPPRLFDEVGTRATSACN